MSGIEIIRTERRRRYSDAEKAALLAEVDRGGCTVAEVARRHEMAESLLYNWRSHRRASASVASEPLQFISYGEVTKAAVDAPATARPATAVSATAPPTRHLEPSAGGLFVGEEAVEVAQGESLFVHALYTGLVVALVKARGPMGLILGEFYPPVIPRWFTTDVQAPGRDHLGMMAGFKLE